MGRSVLEDLGQEVTGVATPVSICMALTVALVRILNPDGASTNGATISIASLYYTESSGDSTGQKLSGALINALIFIGMITMTTFVIVLLFKYRCTKFIYLYFGFSGFIIFFMLTGIIMIELLQRAGAHMDWISLCYILFNFASVGSVTLFFTPSPLFLKQSYLVVIGVAVAFAFTWIPEWTTWVLLVAMAIYDIIAVLVPGGPLKMLVEMAEERDEAIPALVYEARRVRRTTLPQVLHTEELEETRDDDLQNDDVQVHHRRSPQVATRDGGNGETVVMVATTGNRVDDSDAGGDGNSRSSRRSTPNTQNLDHATPQTPLISGTSMEHQHVNTVAENVHEHRPEVMEQPHDSLSPAVATGHRQHHVGEREGIKLGLGDFIFYSVLVGRAAMYDMLTVFACYIAIIAGLGMTLVWLAVAHHALPALPISIALAVVFYFVSRFVMEPVILPMTLHMVFF